MKTIRLKGWTLGMTALFCLPARSADAPEPYYRWTCRAENHYGMTVTPDGKVNPFIRPVEGDANPIYITVRRRADDVWNPPGPRPNWVDSEYTKMDSRYVVVFQMGSSQNSPPFQTNPDGRLMDYDVSGVDRYSDADPKFPHTYPFNLDVTAIYQGGLGYNMLILKPAEKDWVFFVYTGSLRTDTEARRMNITIPHPPGYQSEAEIEISLLTGPCIRETRTMTAN